jgi:integrase
MAVYKRGNNWYIDFTFHGQRIREMIGPSRKGAGKVITKRKAEIAENKFLDVRKDPEPVKFYDFAKEYLQWSKANKKGSSHDRELSTMRRLNSEFEKYDLQNVTTWIIEKWKSKRKEEVKPATVNRELALLKHMFTKAIEWGKVKDNPARKVKLLKGEIKRVRFLMPDEIRTLLSNCADHLRPIVTVALHTGMRKGELLSLQWDQVNFEQKIITLEDTKNRERRDVPMNETVRTTLMGMERKGSHIFCNGSGETFLNVRRSFETAVRKSGIEDFRFHDLRHTFASNLVMEGIDIMTVKELMGHKDLTMTLRYSHLAPNHKMRAVNILDQVMSLIPPQAEIPKKVVQLSVGNH